MDERRKPWAFVNCGQVFFVLPDWTIFRETVSYQTVANQKSEN
jgi:hypothetical protein